MWKEKVALITGSGRGIGKATAEALGLAGCRVVITGRDEVRLAAAVTDLRTQGIEVEGISGDLALPASARSLVQQVVETYGRLDVVINNAGLSMRGRFEELQPEVFREILDANVLNAMNVSRYAIPHLIQTKGSLVFVSSVVGLRALPMTSVYSAAKMALTGLAEALRLELRTEGVHVGIVYVGYTQNAPDKTMMNAQGQLVKLKPRDGGVADTPEGVAKVIVGNVRRRKFKSIHSVPGKVNAILNRWAPSLLERILASLYRRKPHLFE